MTDRPYTRVTYQEGTEQTSLYLLGLPHIDASGVSGIIEEDDEGSVVRFIPMHSVVSVSVYRPPAPEPPEAEHPHPH